VNRLFEPLKVVRFEPLFPDQPVGAAQVGIERFELRNPPYPMKLYAGIQPIGLLEIKVVLIVPDRDSGNHVETVLSGTFDPESLSVMGDALFASVRAMIQKAVEHELDESMYMDGIRTWGPHGVKVTHTTGEIEPWPNCYTTPPPPSTRPARTRAPPAHGGCRTKASVTRAGGTRRRT